MRFSEWVKKNGGQSACAKRLGVTPAAVHYWLKGTSRPSHSAMERIIRAARGQITFEELYRDTSSEGRRARK